MANKKITQLPELSAITTDAETVIVQGGVNYKYKPALMLNIRAFGASPTAAPAANATAIQAAIDAANTAGGGIVFFPPGTYTTTALTWKANVTLVGAGAKLSILKLAAASATIYLIRADTVADIGMRDIGIDGNNANQTIAGTDLRNVLITDCTNVTLERVRVNRNGNGTKGALNDSAGIYLSGGSGHHLEDVEVVGDDLGTGLVVTGASDFVVIKPFVHDMDYSLGSDPGDDRVQGIWMASCSHFILSKPRVRDLGGNFGSGATTKYSRGIVFSGCSDFEVNNPLVKNVDQGMDTTGSDPGNTRFEINGGMITDTYTWGYKFANSARDGTITGAVAVRCGSAGFVVSGGTGTVKSNDITFIGCTAYDIGSNGVWSNESGFRVIAGADGTHPRGIRFVGCRAIDRQGSPTMIYGFNNDVAAGTDGRYNECVDCISIGHVTAGFNGLNKGRVDVGRSAAQVIPNNAWTLVAWSTETDLGAMYTPSDGQIFARKIADYQVTAGVVFEANATGQRGVRVVGNGGAPISGPYTVVDATAAGVTRIQVSWTRAMLAGDEVRIEVFQNSGGNLNLDNESAAVVQEVAP